MRKICVGLLVLKIQNQELVQMASALLHKYNHLCLWFVSYICNLTDGEVEDVPDDEYFEVISVSDDFLNYSKQDLPIQNGEYRKSCLKKA